MTAKDGKPCAKCGGNEWHASGGCASCARERARQWKIDNPERNAASKRQWAKDNPEKSATIKRRWKKNNPEKLAEDSRKWRRNNPEKTATIRRRWKRDNPEKVAESNRQWVKKNPEKVAVIKRRWGKNNPEKAAEKARRWAKNNPEKVAAIDSRRRTLKTKAGGSFTAAEWKALCEHYSQKCLCCGRTDVKLTADHVIPVSKGGTSNIDNIQPLCKSCNSSKCDKTIDYRPGTGLGRWIQKILFAGVTL